MLRRSTRAAFHTLAASLLLVALVWANGVRADTAPSPGPQLPSVTVIARPPPSPQEIAGEAVHDFVRAHAKPSVITGQLARWKLQICPITQGLSPELNEFVSARLLAIAASVGAPRQDSENCKSRHNVYIFFTSDPKQVLEAVEKQDPKLLGFHALDQTKAVETMSRSIQGWYVTVTHGARGGQSIDEADPLLPLESDLMNKGKHPPGLPGSRITSHLSSEIVNAVLVVDLNKTTGHAIGPVADYLAVLTLTQAFAPEQCGTLPSIMDLLAPNCGAREAPTEVTAGDLAFLKALYRTDMELVLEMEQSTINDSMMRQFKAPFAAH
jgi:hypothetical protein